MGLLINAVILYVLVSIFGDSSDTSTRWKVLSIAVVLAVLESMAVARLSGLLWAIGLVAASAIGVAVALELWCKLARVAAIKIAAIFMAIRAALAAALIFWVLPG